MVLFFNNLFAHVFCLVKKMFLFFVFLVNLNFVLKK